ncbi:MAG: glycosyl hydrolase-related protein [Gammaproteobacteria bacterium]|nr:glycosyl hydrolase-related protein [Gammaproteobacteria bacterium]
MVETVKKSEDDDSIIVRLVEACGTDCTATLHFHRPFREVEEVDLIERPLKPVKRRGQEVTVSFHLSTSGHSKSGSEFTFRIDSASRR